MMLQLQRHLWRNSRHLRRKVSTSNSISSKNDEGGEDDKKSRQEAVTNKLNDLLNKMIQEDNNKPNTTVKLAQAVKQKREPRKKERPLGKQLEEAAKDVATSLGGDVKQTESELLQILLQRTEPGSQGLKNVLADMKVEKSQESVSRADQVRASLARPDGKAPVRYDKTRSDMRKPRKKTGPGAYVDILGAEPSVYFKDMKVQPPGGELQTWRSCVERDMRLAVTHPPSNYYEQMIQWTNNGILWHFPVDNFQGLEEEKKVTFEDHIFLEQHLEGWCPEKGPVRHFMELVCVGLSKNYWLSAEEKKAHIMWYRDYFADKNKLLKELGAGNITVEGSEKKDLFESIVHPRLM